MANVFDAALEEMKENGKAFYGPCSFKEYKEKHGLRIRGTAQYISVDSLKNLSSELRQNKTMVFRLGSPYGEKHTHFALSKLENNWNDFFLIDEYIFSDKEVEVFLPTVPLRQLFPFQLLPKLTEASLINLAIASGLLSAALELEFNTNPAAPATGQSTFSFEFKPYPKAKSTWQHNKGQVEIDALFVGRRKGKEILFVIEAKSSAIFSSLAKHKLVYPVLSVSGSVPIYLPIVPIYVRIIRSDAGIYYHIAECELPDPRGCTSSVSELSIVKVSNWIVPSFGVTP